MSWLIGHESLIIFINKIIPALALSGLLISLFSCKWRTSGRLVSTMIHLQIIMWVMLMWADWGSLVFRPSTQTVIARALMLLILILFLRYVKSNNHTAK